MTQDAPAPGPRRRGALFLVGAGPGSPDLLTLRAHALLHSPRVARVIADRLVPPRLLAALDPAKLVVARKLPGRATDAQREIHAWILDALAAGLNVVRLKGGDPFVFGRGGEEAVVARRAGFPVHYVPGVSSATSAPGFAGIPVTHRGIADSLLVVTGRREDGAIPDIPPYDPARTAVFLMAVGALPRLVPRLRAAGFPDALPAAAIERASLPDMRIVRGSLASLADDVRAAGITAHATLVFGHVVDALDMDASPHWLAAEILPSLDKLAAQPASPDTQLVRRLAHGPADPLVGFVPADDLLASLSPPPPSHISDASTDASSDDAWLSDSASVSDSAALSDSDGETTAVASVSEGDLDAISPLGSLSPKRALHAPISPVPARQHA
ncbi:uroporphyrin-III C-methyltransferase [Polyrhizophydium stewartii]|uniref:Uroporphyrin-III C-methyltransferase n=1 Tax=Polyrhizophydium stewartii TaxID=2732419 RepID=A0ABR4MYV5_9FUNG